MATALLVPALQSEFWVLRDESGIVLVVVVDQTGIVAFKVKSWSRSRTFRVSSVSLLSRNGLFWTERGSNESDPDEPLKRELLEPNGLAQETNRPSLTLAQDNHPALRFYETQRVYAVFYSRAVKGCL